MGEERTQNAHAQISEPLIAELVRKRISGAVDLGQLKTVQMVEMEPVERAGLLLGKKVERFLEYFPKPKKVIAVIDENATKDNDDGTRTVRINFAIVYGSNTFKGIKEACVRMEMLKSETPITKFSSGPSVFTRLLFREKYAVMMENECRYVTRTSPWNTSSVLLDKIKSRLEVVKEIQTDTALIRKSIITV